MTRSSTSKGVRIAFLVAILISACTPLSPEQQAETIVAQTMAAATPTPLPSNTPEPTATPTSTVPPPTSTSTATPRPTRTPTITPTPGPVVFTDDMEFKSDQWLSCEKCAWETGMLKMGPFPPTNDDNVHFAICDSCGQPVGYRMAVDATYLDGATDRGFGLLLKGNDEYAIMIEVSVFQWLIVWRYDYDTREWIILNLDPEKVFCGYVRPGKKTNNIEVQARPSKDASVVDLYVYVNGKNVFVLFNQPADPGYVGLEVGFHSIEVSFDNFVFEEFEGPVK